ncbi:MAG: glycosyltransferase family 4 protein [Balneolales bacterium]|nr:glycosyltransferase family 4 protein [Balneolales bacterium]
MKTIYVEPTTLFGQFSGTGRYTLAMIDAIRESSEFVLSQDTERFTKHLHLSKQHPNRHLFLNWTLAGNQTGIAADASIFPNYFMPLAWPIPSAVTIHDVSFLTHPQFYSRKMVAWYSRRIRHSVENARVILTVSEASKNDIIHYLGADSGRIIVHNPDTPMQFENPIPVTRQPYLLYVGNIEPKKNILSLLKAFRDFNFLNPNISLVLAGKLHGSETWKKSISEEIQRTPNCEYKGFVSQQELGDLLMFCSGLVLVSHKEGFGLPVMDALNAGKKVLISEDPALKEIAGNCAITASAHSNQSIIDGLKQLSEPESPHYRESLRIQKKKWEENSPGKMLPQICSYLKGGTSFYMPKNNALYDKKLLNNTFAIASSVSYASVFGASISKSKLRLCHPYPATDNELRNSLMLLLSTYSKEFALENKNTKLILSTIAGKRNADAWNEARFRREHRKLLKILGFIPWIRAVYFSGGTSHQNSSLSRPDLDLLVISKKNYVWLSLISIRLLALLSGKKNTLCSNYLIDESRQEVFWQRDYYTAFQILFLRKVFIKTGTPHFRNQNTWIREFFPNLPESAPEQSSVKLKHTGLFAKYLNITLLFIFNSLWTKKGLKSGEEGLLWDAGLIKLHTKDHRPRVSQLFNKTLRKLTIFHDYAKKQQRPNKVEN